MGEGVRLKNEFTIEHQHNQQPFQPQHSQPQNGSKKLLKETEHNNNNNIDYTIMDTSQQIVLDYLLSSEKGEILKRNGERTQETQDWRENLQL